MILDLKSGVERRETFNYIQNLGGPYILVNPV